jgi:hypothetical protein
VNINVPVVSVMRRMTLTATVTVTGVRVWRVRLWCGVQLIKLAAYIMGTGFRVEYK